MSIQNPDNIMTYETAGGLDPKGLPSAGIASEKEAMGHSVTAAVPEGDDEYVEPSEEDFATLRKVPAAMPWPAIAMCLIEFAERASYYGSTGVFSNFIRNPLPKNGSGTGAVAKGALGDTQSAGALDRGSVTATALTQMFTFLAYVIPIFGGIIADTKWGRFKTICVGTAVGAIAHVLLVIPAIPSVIRDPKGSLGAFIISIIILAFAAGFIKPSLGPLLCDQSPVKRPTVRVLKSGERVIVDPATTIQRYLLIFYWAINIGAFFALATTYAEHDVGFWLAYLLPGIIYMLMPIVLVLAYKRLYKAPPQGSVVYEAGRVIKQLFSNGGWKRAFKGGDAWWDAAKPTVMEKVHGTIDRTRVIWDDKFVDELRQSFSACKVFLLIPIFNLSDGGLGNSEGSMSVAMISNGVPNDLISNFNSLTIVFFAPLFNFVLYPFLEKRGIKFPPMWKLSAGFILGSINMIIGAILQWRVYETSPCGYQATNDCLLADGITSGLSNVSLWAQIPLYSLPAIGEILINVTSYEIAYTSAPARMKGLVYAMVLFSSALSAAISLACSDAIQDPYLIWPYVALAIACALCAVACPLFFSNLNNPVDFANPDRMEGGVQEIDQAHEEANLEKREL